jgi:hypothetical protein
VSVGRFFVQRLYEGPDRVGARRAEFLRGEGPPLIFDPVEYWAGLGVDPETVPEAREQIRRDRDRLIDAVRD